MRFNQRFTWKVERRSLAFYFSLSLVAAIAFSLSGLNLAFQASYVVQDDARQHVFWLQRFVDPGLFPNSLIADYFQSVAPSGYTALYKAFAALGINPLLFSKLLPPILGAIATVYCFGVCWQIFPVPLAGFIVSLLLNQNLWLVDDLSSGTPRAFIYPLLLAFLYYLLRRSIVCCLIIALQGLFYPQAVLISASILLIQLLTVKPYSKRHYLFYGACLATAIIVLLFYAFKTSEFGPVLSASQAKVLPELSAQGRSAFFSNDLFRYWLQGRSGLFPVDWQYLLLFSFGGLLPLLKLRPNWFPLIKKLNSKAIVLLQILLASLALFGLAHLFLFRLHLPSRYTQHTLRIVVALAAGIFMTTVIASASRWLANRLNPLFSERQTAAFIGTLAIVLMLYPTYLVQQYPYRLGYFKGDSPELYQFFRQQPKNSLIASLSKEADFIPTFSARSVLVAQEYAIPYHLGYYTQLRQRIMDTLQAQYTSDLEEVKAFIKKYGVDFWLLEENAFSPEYLQNDPWLMQFQPTAAEAIVALERGKMPVILELVDSCRTFTDGNSIVLETQCLLNQ